MVKLHHGDLIETRKTLPLVPLMILEQFEHSSQIYCEMRHRLGQVTLRYSYTDYAETPQNDALMGVAVSSV